MSTVDFAATLTLALQGIYHTILTTPTLTPPEAQRFHAQIGERVDLFYDLHELEEFITTTRAMVADGYPTHVAADQAAKRLVDDGLLEMARSRGGGWDALYNPALDGQQMPEVDDVNGDWGDYERRESVRGHDPVFADYFEGVARELVQADGLRLTGAIGIRTIADHPEATFLDGPLTVTHIQRDETFGLMTVTVIPRSSMVHEAMGNLPAGVVEGVATLLFNDTDPLLIRY